MSQTNEFPKWFRTNTKLIDRRQLRMHLASLWDKHKDVAVVMVQIEKHLREKFEIEDGQEPLSRGQLDAMVGLGGVVTALIVFSTLLAIARNLLEIWSLMNEYPTASGNEGGLFDE